MAGKLLIIESPNKKKKLLSILGAGWKVEASVGHIRDLPANPKEGIGVDMTTFRPAYEISDGKASVVANLRRCAKDADEVYLATDPDREGEAIAWHIKETLGLKSYKRVTFNEITAAAVKAAIANPRQIDNYLVAAQEARRILDRLVGYTVSPWLTKRRGKGLSAGRVQTPALRLVVERCREIKNFKPLDHFTVRLLFANGWHADWHFKSLVPNGQQTNYWLDRSVAEKAAQVRQLVVKEYQEGPGKKSPPAPFTTSTLQQAASAKLRFSTKTTMDVAQKLFAAGHITYHRTDSPNLSVEACEEARLLAKKEGWPIPDAPRKFPVKSNAQEAHEAIRPTHFEDRAPALDSEEEKKLYELIWIRAVASQLSDALFAIRQAVLEGGGFQYVARGQRLTFPGWMVLLSKDDTKEDQDGSEEERMNNPVPALQIGQALTATDGKVNACRTEPPKAYTEAQLVKKLESEGVGRPSTYASIIENIKGRKYVVIEKNRLVSTQVGELIIDELANNFQFANVDYTRGVEQMLDEVAGGKQALRPVLEVLNRHLEAELKKLDQKSVG